MKKIVSVIGTRPQFIKHAPVELAFKNKVELICVHTGQHYDKSMSQVFFDELGLQIPKYKLNVGSESNQLPKMISGLVKILEKEKPDFVLLYGDTNTTLAGAISAKKTNIPIIHIEAGLRSFNTSMPEEMNRVTTDHLSTYLFAPTQTAVDNLTKEGIVNGVHLVGDVMYDMIELIKPKLHSVDEDDYYLATIHRPYNTDSRDRLIEVLSTLNSLDKTVIFPLHPRTKKYCEDYRIKLDGFDNIKFIEPQSYISSLSLLSSCETLITDSGGMQKEAYMFKKKCITLRPETEWIETLKNGWNTLVFDNLSELENVIKKPCGVYEDGLYGNGRASHRIANSINA